MTQLYFEKTSKYDREREPVQFSGPFAEGRLRDPRQIVVRDGDSPLSFQARALAQWPDGGFNWVLIHCQPDLPGNQDKELALEVLDQPEDGDTLTNAILSGTGTVSRCVTNNALGHITPGPGVGTLTISRTAGGATNDLLFASGSFFDVTIQDTHTDPIALTGDRIASGHIHGVE